jgi:hypothetical protein
MQMTLEKSQVPHKLQLKKVILSLVARPLHTTWQGLKDLSPRGSNCMPKSAAC